MKKILVPVDGSGAALRALGAAVDLARLAAASLRVVHCHEEPDVSGRLALYVSRDKMDGAQRAHSEEILDRASTALADAKVAFEKAVLSGPVARTIAADAERSGCDLIVMGRHGHSALEDMLVGSIAMKVLHASRKPVMLVR